MATPDRFVPPSFPKLVLTFGLGLAFGLAFVLPSIGDLATVVALQDMGSVGNVLIAGVLSIVVVTTGLFGLYRLFWLVDR